MKGNNVFIDYNCICKSICDKIYEFFKKHTIPANANIMYNQFKMQISYIINLKFALQIKLCNEVIFFNGLTTYFSGPAEFTDSQNILSTHLRLLAFNVQSPLNTTSKLSHERQK